MARDIEEFLRRAAERRQQQKAGQAPKQPVRPETEEVEVEIVESEGISRPSSIRPDVIKPTPRTSRKTNLRRESVSDHVDRHLDNSNLGARSGRLGKKIVSVHDRVEASVHEHLDHDISIIDDRPTITDDERPGVFYTEASDLAKELLKLLSEPQTISQAILLSEILTRPDWDDDEED